MSLSKMHKANTAARKAQGKAPLSFAEYAEFCDRAANARAARTDLSATKVFKSSTPKTRKAKAVKAVTPKIERVPNRVDCMGASKKGIVFIGVDKADANQVAQILKAKVVRPYSSGRGERVLLSTSSKIKVATLTAAGFTPKGF